MKYKRESIEDLKKEFNTLRAKLYGLGYWITESQLLHVTELSDRELLYVFEDKFLIKAYHVAEKDLKGTKSEEDVRLAALELAAKHPLYKWLYAEIEDRKLYVDDAIYWLLTGEDV
jgi:hypothetical protein